jgi:hypothetical protein
MWGGKKGDLEENEKDQNQIKLSQMTPENDWTRINRKQNQ